MVFLVNIMQTIVPSTPAIGNLQFQFNSDQELVSTPIGGNLESFLVFDQYHESYRQLVVHSSGSPANKTCSEVWFNVKQSSPEGFANIVAIGEDDGLPFYVAELPSGEPVKKYARKHNLSIPYTANLILEFLNCLSCQSAFPIGEWQISIDSLWISEDDKGQLKIQLGDIALQPEDKNNFSILPLIVDLFENLAGNSQSRKFAAALSNKDINFAKAINLLKRLACTPPLENDLPKPAQYFEHLVIKQQEPTPIADDEPTIDPEIDQHHAFNIPEIREVKDMAVQSPIETKRKKKSPLSFVTKLAIHTLGGLALGVLCFFVVNQLKTDEKPPSLTQKSSLSAKE